MVARQRHGCETGAGACATFEGWVDHNEGRAVERLEYGYAPSR